MAGDWVFWAVAAGLAGAVAWLLWGGVQRGQALGLGQADVQVYKDQLAEVDRDAERGVIPADEAARLRVEVARRLLEADKAGQAERASSGGPVWPVLGLIGLCLAGAFAFYWWLGAPGYPDFGMADRMVLAEKARLNRPKQAEAEAALPVWADPAMDAETADLIGKLRAVVAARPEDAQGLGYLVQYEAELGNYRAAAVAQGQLIALKSAVSAADELLLADLLIRTVNGYVSPEAEAALTKVLQQEPENALARYYSGLMLAQTGRPDLAFRLWERLLAEGPQDAVWMGPLRANIESVAAAAGVAFTLPAVKGPEAADIAAAAGMSDSERAAMIRGMVAGLQERLGREGGTAAEWAQLIGALGVLGEQAQARAIYAEAEKVFAGSAADLAAIKAAAVQAGVAE